MHKNFRARSSLLPVICPCGRRRQGVFPAASAISAIQGLLQRGNGFFGGRRFFFGGLVDEQRKPWVVKIVGLKLLDDPKALGGRLVAMKFPRPIAQRGGEVRLAFLFQLTCADFQFVPLFRLLYNYEGFDSRGNHSAHKGDDSFRDDIHDAAKDVHVFFLRVEAFDANSKENSVCRSFVFLGNGFPFSSCRDL
jgi:hypothetical protein